MLCARRLIVGRVGARINPKLERLDGEVVRPLRRQREQEALAQAE